MKCNVVFVLPYLLVVKSSQEKCREIFRRRNVHLIAAPALGWGEMLWDWLFCRYKPLPRWRKITWRKYHGGDMEWKYLEGQGIKLCRIYLMRCRFPRRQICENIKIKVEAFWEIRARVGFWGEKNGIYCFNERDSPVTVFVPNVQGYRSC